MEISDLVWIIEQDGKTLRLPPATPAGVRHASTWIGNPIRFRARDCEGFFDWAGSCPCDAAISAFVTRGGGAADTSNKTTMIAGQGRNRMRSAFQQKKPVERVPIDEDSVSNHTTVSKLWQSSIGIKTPFS